MHQSLKLKLKLVGQLAILAFMGVGCATADGADADTTVPVNIQVSAVVGDKAAACGVDYSDLGASKATAQLADARLFISQVELRSADGTWTPVALGDRAPWQHAGVTLLDFEDGTAACQDSGTTQKNDKITGTVAAGNYTAVRLHIGVPFDQNHVDNATSPAPFNTPGMFWTWQGGYKFLRVDWKVQGGAIPRWNVHIGSTKCAAKDKITAPSSPCGRPNLSTVTIDVADAANAKLRLDLAALVAKADISADTESSPPGCMSAPTEPGDCSPVWTALGMAFDSGACAGSCAAQTVWSAQ